MPVLAMVRASLVCPPGQKGWQMGAENHGAETTQKQEAAQEHGNEQAAQEQQEVTAAADADWEKQLPIFMNYLWL